MSDLDKTHPFRVETLLTGLHAQLVSFIILIESPTSEVNRVYSFLSLNFTHQTATLNVQARTIRSGF